MPNDPKKKIIFLRQFLARPKEVASVIPSSTGLVRRLLADYDFAHARLVVEYGPGTGAITKQILIHLPETCSYVGAEPNAVFRDLLTKDILRHQGDQTSNEKKLGMRTLIADYAQNISQKVLKEFGQADLVVSGLPCSIIPLDVLRDLFASTHKLLRDGGEMRMFVYTHTLIMPKMSQMMQLLSAQFKEVFTDIEWSNFPPATVIRCVK